MDHDLYQYVDEDRLRSDITQTAEFGSVPVEEGNCRTVLTGTEANKQVREYFVEKLEERGLKVCIDAVGNIAGRWVPDNVDPAARSVATGSHLDSVIDGGMFDGVLGVYAGLEAVRAMQDAGLSPGLPLEVIAFTEEEGGRFSDGVLGSSVAIGDSSVADALATTDKAGVTLGEALEEIGFKGEERLDATAWNSWLELHVEQGTRLEETPVSAGIVTHITGTIRCHIDILGEANHAGTTSMESRTDALTAASELALEIESVTNEVVKTHSKTAVGTVGQFDVEPGSINVIPGSVHLGVDIRDIEYQSMERIISGIQQCLDRLEDERSVETTFSRPYDIEPISMSERCIEALHSAATQAKISTIELHSGAGHDTMHVAKATDAGLIFAPSEGGYSHSAAEWTDWSDCATSTRLLTGALYDLANQ
ncbi:N-carbamyol-L-amino acid amidohydrolase [Natronococcus amylolyticus DSM 10524]|uniref:N-carbamyol-L-amino acid amidohydrolase n=1 Tax=Natronococcus amylolyticus DSM 10524 TaxID=1227497 RepID=L9X3L3_9EURY|nr:M20 family metallo-hydrolase [Natronococcus amylolyticus]ELY56315.1 N-carbamyol-L-amino acid amidohydrolase [Natronococcus amylolyticus DSM 10524]